MLSDIIWTPCRCSTPRASTRRTHTDALLSRSSPSPLDPGVFLEIQANTDRENPLVMLSLFCFCQELHRAELRHGRNKGGRGSDSVEVQDSAGTQTGAASLSAGSESRRRPDSERRGAHRVTGAPHNHHCDVSSVIYYCLKEELLNDCFVTCDALIET